LRDWLPEGHLAYFVSDVVDQLDLSAIEGYYEKEERGYPPFHPGLMVKVLVYGYCVGVFSVAQPAKTFAGRCWISGVGGGQRARFSHLVGLSQANFDSILVQHRDSARPTCPAGGAERSAMCFDFSSR